MNTAIIIIALGLPGQAGVNQSSLFTSGPSVPASTDAAGSLAAPMQTPATGTVRWVPPGQAAVPVFYQPVMAVPVVMQPVAWQPVAWQPMIQRPRCGLFGLFRRRPRLIPIAPVMFAQPQQYQRHTNAQSRDQ